MLNWLSTGIAGLRVQGVFPRDECRLKCAFNGDTLVPMFVLLPMVFSSVLRFNGAKRLTAAGSTGCKSIFRQSSGLTGLSHTG